MGRILIIRGGAIGDFILTLPAIRLLRDSFPEAHFEILGYKHILSVAEGRYYANATRCIEYSALAGFFVPNGSLDADLVKYFGSFQQVVSYLYDPDGFFEANIRRCGVRHYLSGSPKIGDSVHACEQLAKPLQSLALYLEDKAAVIFPNQEDLAFAKEFVGTKPLVAMHPGSGSPRKNWAVENWFKLGLCLNAAGMEIVLVGGEADGSNLDVLRQNWSFPVRLARGLPLPKLGAILCKCALFIGHDSGISHLAAAAGSRCVLLFGPTDPNVWAPANSGVEVIASPSGQMEGIGYEIVEAKILQACSEQLARGAEIVGAIQGRQS